MRTNKTQRIAINLTKLADSVDALDFSTGLYSIAKDSNIAMIESDNFWSYRLRYCVRPSK